MSGTGIEYLFLGQWVLFAIIIFAVHRQIKRDNPWSIQKRRNELNDSKKEILNGKKR